MEGKGKVEAIRVWLYLIEKLAIVNEYNMIGNYIRFIVKHVSWMWKRSFARSNKLEEIKGKKKVDDK